MVKNDFNTGQINKADEKSVNSKTANNKSVAYRSITGAAVKEAQRDNRERNITNWYLIDGKLINDRLTATVSVSKPTSHTSFTEQGARKKAKSNK